MVDVSKLSSSFAVIAPAAVNQSYKVLRDLGATASPVTTDLRQQSYDLRQFGNSSIEQLQAGNSVEEARGLSQSEELSRTVASAVDAASQRLAAVSARNNQRESSILKNGSSTSSAASAIVALLSKSDSEDDDIFSALFATSSRSASRKASPIDMVATSIKGPKYGEDIFERGIQPMVGAGGGVEVSIARRALRDEEVKVYINPDDETSTSTTVLRGVADGSYKTDNDGFIINGKLVNANTTAVYDTRDPNNEDPRRSSITHNFGSGSDVLFAAGDNDTFADGGAGDDVMIAEGNSVLRGGEGDDLIAGQTAFGDAGDDIIFSSGFASGGTGDDVIGLFQIDPEDPQRLTGMGGEGNDVIIADDAAAAYGDEGDDSIILRQGGLALGGTGDDTITSFGRAEIDAGEGDDDIRLGASGADFQVGGVIVAGAGDDVVESYGYTDLSLGSGKDVADLGNGGVVRFSKGDGADLVTLGDTAFPKLGEIRKTNTVILNEMLPADVTITVTGFKVTIAINGTTDKLTLQLNSISEPLNLRFEKASQMQVVTIQNTLQTVGPLVPKTPFIA